ncbi:ATP-binding cassette domain-containing protein [Gracilibacillus caseinilyticus]|uniref:Nickel import system ATP-binding protein NikD n=1 Tax=Gracilibacillus caseinilyticus TaxID=2932256 RepID=A0ABY4F239_9BACI|nr:ATP-binding cassette domain-containing protein [Gracilibacillus caseinilyticus]UOQ48491.1 ATP-binding cassette domain-containing protein [Gracilibacillus caseinilyticus]
MNNLLTIKELDIFHQQSRHYLLQDINLSLTSGEILALVGESGSGKSLLAQAILQMLPYNLEQKGDVFYRGQRFLSNHRGKNIILIPQSIDALDPLMKIGKQIEGLMQKGDHHQQMLALLIRLGLDTEIADRYPFQLSGGQARRVLVAIAIGSSADVVIADEPTPGLDQKAKQDMITLLKEVQQAGKSILLITHDFDAALQLAEQIAVLKDGRILEIVNRAKFTGEGERLQHPFTKKMWQSLPQNLFTRS